MTAREKGQGNKEFNNGSDNSSSQISTKKEKGEGAGKASKSALRAEACAMRH